MTKKLQKGKEKMIYIVYRMMGKWYPCSVENWHRLTSFLEAYEDDIEDIYISSNASEVLDKLKVVDVS